MGIGLTEEHVALAASVHGVAGRGADHAALAAQGLLGLHLPEECGGQGFGLLELCVAVEALGERRIRGAYLPTVLASAVLGAYGAELPAGTRLELLRGLAGGSLTAAVALLPGCAIGSAQAELFVVPAGDGGWAVLDRGDVTAGPLEGVDPDRPLCAVTARAVPAGRVLGGAPVRELAAVLLGADACGVAAWAVATAAGHAKVREQFGRPIGQFQGVKHRVAGALVALEQARAAVWDAARALDETRGPASGTEPAAGAAPGTAAEPGAVTKPEALSEPGAVTEPGAAGEGLGEEVRLAVSVAAVLAPDAAVRCTADAIQVLGGIGYTFEHDAHRYYRRALSGRMLAGDPGPWAEEAARMAVAGVRRRMEPDLPAEAAPVRDAIRAQAESLRAGEQAARRARLAREGWIMPHLPRPWGRSATPLEQVIIHQEFRDLGRPNLGIAAWAVPSIVRYGTREQQERFLPGTFAGEIVWCQLFSEPGAGSDLAGLTTKAARVEGGWSLTGQKIWTSLAQYAHWGICLARTSPDRPKHDGISYFLVDMSSPGVTVRPLKEINGDEIFNEVFLDDVFVPDDLVVGAVNEGWRVARDTLSHERVALGDSWGPGSRHTDMARHIARLPPLRQAQREQAGRLWAEGQAISALGLRVTLSQLAGADPGAAPSVRKLLGMRHAQAISEFCWSLDPSDRYWSRMILGTRAFTIGGGTTEVQLNIIAERALGLPRDP
ncbi:alkylation response protein AidB-like acyl-CoA dehydrogenase [Nonomuraea thailandensis]|uniref:Alkylation response protein AidB-like acyl-CoA dehydrogenase n=1 Tax=Nonomuraea thailandensis TaxID=1188745 RepID=A0A9X2G886_9ACTN|nr:acyl-CoA dehydrogenase [Nonomuraea thailandensis]MCP2354332.1 alkylation response protein AidB-like acyl-CoA dehydrogenase [Nonomuraea thailandensis]